MNKENPYEPLDIFIRRLRKIGVEVKLAANWPYIYLSEINGKKVTERLNASHGFNVAWLTMKEGVKFDEIEETFKLLRKYADRHKS